MPQFDEDRHTPRRCKCAACGFSEIWGPRWTHLGKGKYVCSPKCEKAYAIKGLLSGIKTFEDRPGPNGSREIIFTDKEALEGWCRDHGIRVDWIRKKPGQEIWYLRLWGKHKAV